MRRAAFAIFAGLFLFAAAPSQAQLSNLEVATKFSKAVQRGDKKAVSRFFAPRIIWGRPNQPDRGEVVAGAYGIHLAVLNFKIGSVKSVVCTVVDDKEVACDFLRVSLFGDGERHLIEHYFVENGLIVKVVDEIPPEVVSFLKNG